MLLLWKKVFVVTKLQYQEWLTFDGTTTLDQKEALEDRVTGIGSITDRSPRSIFISIEAEDLWELRGLVEDLWADLEDDINLPAINREHVYEA